MCSLLPFATGIYHYALCNIFFFSVHFFIINKLEWLMIPACPGLMCSFNRGNIEGTLQKFAFDVYVLFYVCKVIVD